MAPPYQPPTPQSTKGANQKVPFHFRTQKVPATFLSEQIFLYRIVFIELYQIDYY